MNGVELLELSEPEYRAMPAVNWSTLKHMNISPLQYQWELKNGGRSTSAMGLGTVEHLAVLTPEQFIGHTAIFTEANRGTKGFDKFAAANDNKIPVTPEEHAMIMLHIKRFRDNESFETITYDAKIEQCMRWTDPKTGLICKCRPDMFNDVSLTDLKTTRHVEDDLWWWDFKKKRYHAQFAFYHDALRLLDGRDRTCVVVKLETEPAYDVVYYPLPDQAIIEGRAHYQRLMRELRDCIQVNAWPGKCDELAPVKFNNWVIEKAA